MLLYIDADGLLQYMPYRKTGSHQERVPWISHHPTDVKRGTFIGELTRMATLSSTYQNYRDAVEDLIGIYSRRGYPHALIMQWTKKHAQERWLKRLATPIDRAPEGVLVLKSVHNNVWEHFSATELGNTITGYWSGWLNAQEVAKAAGKLPPYPEFPQLGGLIGDLADTKPELTTLIDTVNGPVKMPDVRKLDILQRRWLVSKKRTRNLFDLTSIWKTDTIAVQERKQHEEIASTIKPPTPQPDVDLDTPESSPAPEGPQIGPVRFIRERSVDDFVSAWNKHGSGWAL